MKYLPSLVLGVAAAATASVALAQEKEGNWMFRVRAIDVRPVEKWADAGVLGLPGGDVYVKDKTVPEVDFTYFFTRNLAAELILTYPQKLHVRSKTLGDLGSFKALPPIVSFQYHFAPEATFRPYVGIGLNYTAFSSKKIDRVAPLTIENDSVGASIQLGFDYKIGKNSFINLDISIARTINED